MRQMAAFNPLEFPFTIMIHLGLFQAKALLAQKYGFDPAKVNLTQRFEE
jgi:hypothetical protein